MVGAGPGSGVGVGIGPSSSPSSIRLQAWSIVCPASPALPFGSHHSPTHTHQHAAHAADTIAPRDSDTVQRFIASHATTSPATSQPGQHARAALPQPTKQPTTPPPRGSLHHHAFARRPLAELPGFLHHGRATPDSKQHEQSASTAHKAPQQRVVKRRTTPPLDQSQLRWGAPTTSVATPSGRTPCRRTSATPPCQDCAAAQPQQCTQFGQDGSRTNLTRCLPTTATAD